MSIIDERAQQLRQLLEASGCEDLDILGAYLEIVRAGAPELEDADPARVCHAIEDLKRYPRGAYLRGARIEQTVLRRAQAYGVVMPVALRDDAAAEEIVERRYQAINRLWRAQLGSVLDDDEHRRAHEAWKARHGVESSREVPHRLLEAAVRLRAMTPDARRQWLVKQYLETE